MRSFSRLGSSLSVLDFLHLGATLALRSFARMGASVALLGIARLGSVFSLSVLDFLHLGSSMALRSVARLGSSLSVLDFLHLGSTLSLRSLSRLGSTLSVLDFIQLGSSLSMRSFVRLGSAVSLNSCLEFSNPDRDTYMHFSSTMEQVELYVKGLRAISAAAVDTQTGKGGGILHGYWYADYIIHTSDLRLKTNIRPLMEELEQKRAAATKQLDEGKDSSGSAARTREGGRSREDGASWLLRELRPVSYNFRRDAEAKTQRFGFIADEVQTRMPELIRERSDAQRTKGIVYQDLIAILTAALQSLTHRVEIETERGLQSEAEFRRQVSELQTQFERQLKEQELGFTNQLRALEESTPKDSGASLASLGARIDTLEKMVSAEISQHTSEIAHLKKHIDRQDTEFAELRTFVKEHLSGGLEPRDPANLGKVNFA